MLLAHHREYRAGDVHRAYETRRQLPLHLLRRQLLEVAGVKAGGIVDQHVDAAEAVNSGPHCRLGIGAASDVQLDGQQVIRLSQGLRHAVAVPARGHNCVAGRQRGLSEIDAHATAGSSDEPSLLVIHEIAFLGNGWTSPSFSICEECRQLRRQAKRDAMSWQQRMACDFTTRPSRQ